MLCKSNELGLDKTLKTLVPRENVFVVIGSHNDNNSWDSDTPRGQLSDLSGTQGVYIDMSNNNDIGVVSSVFKVISENPKKYGITASQYEHEYLPGDVVTALSTSGSYCIDHEFDEGGMYVDPSSVNGVKVYSTILNDGTALSDDKWLYDMSLSKIPYTGDNFIVAEKSAIKTKRKTKLDDVYRLNPFVEINGFLCKTNEFLCKKTAAWRTRGAAARAPRGKF